MHQQQEVRPQDRTGTPAKGELAHWRVALGQHVRAPRLGYGKKDIRIRDFRLLIAKAEPALTSTGKRIPGRLPPNQLLPHGYSSCLVFECVYAPHRQTCSPSKSIPAFNLKDDLHQNARVRKVVSDRDGDVGSLKLAPTCAAPCRVCERPASLSSCTTAWLGGSNYHHLLMHGLRLAPRARPLAKSPRLLCQILRASCGLANSPLSAWRG